MNSLEKYLYTKSTLKKRSVFYSHFASFAAKRINMKQQSMIFHNNLSFDLLTYFMVQSFASYQTYIPIKKQRKIKKTHV